ncbi:hypothetical protein VOLCADRAFT_76718 [Volvox carteri f. nagariensis]|uniref:PDZ domain-containing protein n=1 Tax=Volvox carteri f. nagariensis TaxID=3068 RepID=D8U9U2_VOLCA|nr:uncharacterized protein VOLCADRAFT_76718 [Volvox carteri f. nagariensis]EFJ43470.1 hypothetical protein VOLCADRAFT_76718 [Volvox carteri f. nagariensis]|eukprot:XP_002955399.1 hypothetical protein VOLCADRAFT_76718 [Volvox carteri f. nagariensis]
MLASKPALRREVVSTVSALPCATMVRSVARCPSDRLVASFAVASGPKVLARRHVLVQAQAGTKTGPPATTTEEEYIELDLPKPLGFKFARGNDGGAYIIDVNPKLGNVDARVQPGDKIVLISASFGSEVWKAENFGQIMYAIRTRSGTVYMKLKRNFGDLSALEEDGVDAAEKMWKKERAGGNYGAGTKEIQARNYVQRKENERKRREMFDDALAKFKENDIQGALVEFENIIAMEPRNYVGDNFSRNTPIYKVAQYNIACCYSMLDQVEEALKSLDSAMSSGFDNFDQIRRDKNLVKVRASPKFQQLIDKYDEPVVNWNAVKATFGAFGGLFGGKKDE